MKTIFKYESLKMKKKSIPRVMFHWNRVSGKNPSFTLSWPAGDEYRDHPGRFSDSGGIILDNGYEVSEQISVSVMCTNCQGAHDLAKKLFQVLRILNLEKKISITGYGNLAHSGGLLQIPGAEQHLEEIGAQGVNELIRMIEDPDYASSGLIEIETELVNLDKLPWIGEKYKN